MNKVPLIVTTDWLEANLDDPDLRVVDATVFMQFPEGGGPPNVESGKASYEQGHIRGAVFADLTGALSDPNSDLPFTVPKREPFTEHLTQLGIGDNTYTVIYDQNALVGDSVAASYWASRLAWQMRYEGFENIAVLEGGLQKWLAEGREVTTETTTHSKASFSGKRRDDMLASKEDVQQALHDEQVVLINSLSADDHESGHIPNSHNVFFGQHADANTKAILGEEQLRASFKAAGALDPNKKVITYCGGGIAATWTALVLNRLGQPNVAVYDGSMNEWTSDPTCPIVSNESR